MKLLPRFALLGLVGGLLGSSFAMPAAAAVSDSHTDYAGPSTGDSSAREAYVEEYLYVYCDDYIYYYRYEYGAVEDQAFRGNVLTDAASERIFDQ